jgi:hypothetical protein
VFPPPAFASWSSCSRRGIGRSSRSAYRIAIGEPDPDGVSTFRTLKQRPGWVPSISRGRRCSPGLATITSPRLSHLSDASLRPATTTHLSETLLHETSTKGSNDFTRPVFPSPVAPGWNGSPWALPRASHPDLTGDARRGGDRPSSTSLKHALRHQPNLQPRGLTRYVRPRVALVNAEVWVRRVRVLRFLKGGTDRLRRRDCCFDRSTGRPLAGFVQAPAVGGLSLARELASGERRPRKAKAEAAGAASAPSNLSRSTRPQRARQPTQAGVAGLVRYRSSQTERPAPAGWLLCSWSSGAADGSTGSCVHAVGGDRHRLTGRTWLLVRAL